jgi:hypothetical protein
MTALNEIKISEKFAIMANLVATDAPELAAVDITSMVASIMRRPSVPGACVHQMPRGTSAIVDGVRIRCGSTETAR